MNTKVVLTNMCMLYNSDGEILVQNRIKNDWPGINFPGGHVKYNESLEESCIREIKEETGLNINKLEFVAIYEWNIPQDKIRHLAILYKSSNFSGTLKSSKEGEMFWISPSEINRYKQAVDFDKILDIMLKK